MHPWGYRVVVPGELFFGRGHQRGSCRTQPECCDSVEYVLNVDVSQHSCACMQYAHDGVHRMMTCHKLACNGIEMSHTVSIASHFGSCQCVLSKADSIMHTHKQPRGAHHSLQRSGLLEDRLELLAGICKQHCDTPA